MFRAEHILVQEDDPQDDPDLLENGEDDDPDPDADLEDDEDVDETGSER
jgi:hypothetical protein